MADPIITIAQRLKPAFARIGGISEADADAVVRRSDRADAQVNGSLALAKQLGKTPREIAQLVLDEADLSSVCSSVEIAGPGFINVTFAPEFLAAELARAAADPRWQDVRHRFVLAHLCTGRQDRQKTLEVRAPPARGHHALLRRDQPRRSPV